MQQGAPRAGTPGALHAGGARRRAPLVLLALCAAVVLVALTGAHASAHANLATADPAPGAVLKTSPPRVTITFTEPMAASLSAIEVLDTAGHEVDRRNSAVDPHNPERMTVSLPTLPHGTYTVAWHNVSNIDGHALRGLYVFYVGAKPANAPASAMQSPPLFPSPAEPVVRWLVLSGLLAAFGALAFQVAVAWPATAGDSDSDSDDAARRALAATIERRTRRVAAAAVALLLVAVLVHIDVEAMTAYQRSPLGALGRLGSVIGATQWGHMWAARLVLTLAAAAVLAAWLRRPTDPTGSSRRAVLLALALVAGAMLTMSLASHDAGTPNIGPAATMNDFLHILAAGAWAGGLVAFAPALHAALRVSEPRARHAATAALAARFSALGLLGAGTLLVTGVYSAWAQVTTPSALETTYGHTVLVKSALFVGLMGLAAVNLRVLRPRLAASDGAGRWLARLVAAEVTLAVLVVMATGALTSMEPAREVASREAIAAGVGLEQRAGSTQVHVAVQPGTVGSNRVVVDLADARGRPVTDATVVALQLQFLDADLGTTSLTVHHTSGGEYVANDVPLSIVGHWRLSLAVSRPGAFDAHATWTLPVTAPSAHPGSRFQPGARAGDLAWAVEVILVAALLLAVTNSAWARDRAARALNLAGGTALVLGIAGLAVVATGLWHPAAPTGPPFHTAIAMRYEAPGNRFVLLEADPFQPGINRFRVTVLDAQGHRDPTGHVALRFSRLDDAVAPQTVPAAAATPAGTYTATHALTLTGWWDIDVMLDGSLGATFDVRVDAPSKAPEAWAPAPKGAASDPQAEALFKRALARYGTISSMHWTDQITSGQLAPHGLGGWVRDDGVGVAPGDIRIITTETIGGAPINQVVRKGTMWCTWSSPGPWDCRLGAALPPFNPDDYAGATDIQLGRIETVAGHVTRAVTFYIPSQQYWYAWWIDPKTDDLWREVLLGPYHIMYTTYSDHGAPATITLPAAAASVTPTATSTATPPAGTPTATPTAAH